MKIVMERPPNFAAIAEAFPWVKRHVGILYAWDAVIYNPDGIEVTSSLLAHEVTHSKQIAGDPLGWWDKYLADPVFRFAQEVPAHIEEYAYVAAHEPKRAHRRLYLKDIAARLAGPLYGNLTTIEIAKRLLKTGDWRLACPEPKGTTA